MFRAVGTGKSSGFVVGCSVSILRGVGVLELEPGRRVPTYLELWIMSWKDGLAERLGCSLKVFG